MKREDPATHKWSIHIHYNDAKGYKVLLIVVIT